MFTGTLSWIFFKYSVAVKIHQSHPFWASMCLQFLFPDNWWLIVTNNTYSSTLVFFNSAECFLKNAPYFPNRAPRIVVAVLVGGEGVASCCCCCTSLFLLLLIFFPLPSALCLQTQSGKTVFMNSCMRSSHPKTEKFSEDKKRLQGAFLFCGLKINSLKL